MEVMIPGSDLSQVVSEKANHLREEVNEKDPVFVANYKMPRNDDFQAKERLMITEFQVWVFWIVFF